MVQPRYKTIVDAFAADIRSGRLSPGARLPTHRQLARREGVALVTASRVYAELEAIGLVVGETGRGTFVRETSLPAGLGIEQQAALSGLTDLNFNSPSLPGQGEMLRSALRELASSGDLEALLRYQPHAGRQHERAIFARHLLARGIEAAAEQILIVNGATHGLAAVVLGLFRPGDVVAVDALTYPGFKLLAETMRLDLAPVPVRSDGLDLTALARICKDRHVRAVYTMPTLHNPLGCVMTPERRQELVAIARKHELLIIEDAAYAFLVDDAPAPVAAIAPELTIYVSGLSKSVATGLRVGFVAAPAHYVPMIERAIRATAWNTAGVMTAIACNWIVDGTVSQLEAQKRDDARVRQQIAAEVLTGTTRIAHPASYFIWLPFTEDVRADLVAMALIRENIAVSTAEPFATTEQVPHAIRLALGSVDLTSLRESLGTVRDAINAYTY